MLVSYPISCHLLLLLVERKLKSGEWKVASEGGFVAGEELREPLFANNGTKSIHGGAVVVAAVKVGVVKSALELQSRFEYFGRNVKGRCAEICEEAWEMINTQTLCKVREHVPEVRYARDGFMPMSTNVRLKYS